MKREEQFTCIPADNSFSLWCPLSWCTHAPDAPLHLCLPSSIIPSSRQIPHAIRHLCVFVEAATFLALQIKLAVMTAAMIKCYKSSKPTPGPISEEFLQLKLFCLFGPEILQPHWMERFKPREAITFLANVTACLSLSLPPVGPTYRAAILAGITLTEKLCVSISVPKPFIGNNISCVWTLQELKKHGLDF